MLHDIIGPQIFNYGSGTFTTQLGPVHANVVLLDEINRSSAKTQSAMLEAMQERQTSVGGERSEEHTSELQSRGHLVCRLLLEKKNRTQNMSVKMDNRAL